MGLELMETVGVKSAKTSEPIRKPEKGLRDDLKAQVVKYEALGWVIDLDHKKNLYSAKLDVSVNTDRPITVELSSNASVDSLLLQIDQFQANLQTQRGLHALIDQQYSAAVADYDAKFKALRDAFEAENSELIDDYKMSKLRAENAETELRTRRILQSNRRADVQRISFGARHAES